jgi:diacylglycerol kinase family enzyme
MILFLNPASGGGTAPGKWTRIAPEFHALYGPCETVSIASLSCLGPCVRESFNSGERVFLAGGGDGTINVLLNTVLKDLPSEAHDTVILGAVGLGSSNDFHKPRDSRMCPGGIPCAADPHSARPRDVGVVTFRTRTGRTSRYFLVNASIGMTADANRFFNDPDVALRFLKRTATPLAILYAAAKTLFQYSGQDVWLRSPSHLCGPRRLTNLALLKSPHISGNLKFPCRQEFVNGLFEVFLAGDLGLSARCRFLEGLSHGRISAGLGLQSWRADVLSVLGRDPFAVEYDGEVVTTTYVHFAMLPRHLKVCTC